jgi:hypothetical protein
VLARLWRPAGPTKNTLARELIELIAAARRGRAIHVVADSAYICTALRHLPANVTLTGPLPRHAALWEVHPDLDDPPCMRGRRGRPRTPRHEDRHTRSDHRRRAWTAGHSDPLRAHPNRDRARTALPVVRRIPLPASPCNRRPRLGCVETASRRAPGLELPGTGRPRGTSVPVTGLMPPPAVRSASGRADGARPRRGAGLRRPRPERHGPGPRTPARAWAHLGGGGRARARPGTRPTTSCINPGPPHGGPPHGGSARRATRARPRHAG